MFYWKKMFKQRSFLIFQFSILLVLMLRDSLIGKFLALVNVKKQTLWLQIKILYIRTCSFIFNQYCMNIVVYG